MKEENIVFFIGALGSGGAERVVSILTRQYVQKGIPVEIVLYYDEHPFYDIQPEIKITYVERETGSRNMLKNILWLRRYFIQNADLVISFLAQFNMVALAAAFATGIPIIVADRNDPRHMPKQAPVRIARNLMYHFADAIVVQTQHNKEYFSPVLQKKCSIIYNPVDLQGKKGLALRTAKKPRIVSAARLMKQKNQLMLLDAFAQIQKDFPAYTLTIYGEGPFRGELEKKIGELGLEDSVFLPGKVQNIFDCIADADLFVLSSDFEGMPNALIEAMCLGLPVISTRVSGATDLIQNEKNGFLTDIGDTAQLTECMRKMLSDSKLRQNFAEKSVQISNILDVTKIMEQWVNCIERVKR